MSHSRSTIEAAIRANDLTTVIENVETILPRETEGAATNLIVKLRGSGDRAGIRRLFIKTIVYHIGTHRASPTVYGELLHRMQEGDQSERARGGLYENRMLDVVSSQLMRTGKCTNFLPFFGSIDVPLSESKRFLGASPEVANDYLAKSTKRFFGEEIGKRELSELSESIKSDPNLRVRAMVVAAIDPSTTSVLDEHYMKWAKSGDRGRAAAADVADMFPIIFQIGAVCCALASIGVSHQDMHSGNFWIETLRKPRTVLYTIDGVEYRFWTRHKIACHDFDRSFGALIGEDNPFLTKSRCRRNSQCNSFNDKMDLYKALSGLSNCDETDGEFAGSSLKSVTLLRGLLSSFLATTPSRSKTISRSWAKSCTLHAGGADRRNQWLDQNIVPPPVFLRRIGTDARCWRGGVAPIDVAAVVAPDKEEVWGKM